MAADPNRPDTWSTLGKLMASLIAAGVLLAGVLLPIVGGAGVVAGTAAGKFLDTTCTLQESQPPEPTTIYARDGKTVIARLFKQDRVPVPLSQVPQYLQDALIATEDRRFYKHHGVDLRGLIRSAINTSAGDTQGGSTLTMQYVKQVRYYEASEISDAKKRQQAENAAIDVNLDRKMEDAQCALQIEKHESKGEILDNYLNIAFFGENAYGIQVAAETYFNKPASDLTLDESALLVGLLRAPSAYDPFTNRVAAKQRRDQVLQNLVDVGKLSQSVADREKQKPISLATQSPPQVREGCANASTKVQNAAFFCEYLVDWLDQHNGISESQLSTGGYKIVATLDPTLQNSMQKRMTKLVHATSPMTAVLPAVDPNSGDVLAMASSKTYGTRKGQTEQPIFTKPTAQGASTFKLFPLLTALSTGVPSNWPLTTIGNFGTWKTTRCALAQKVTNGDENVSYSATETLSSATAKSSNTYFVALADELLQCNLQPIVDLATKLGISSLNNKETSKLTVGQAIVQQQRARQLTLGFVPASPLELAGAYTVVANEGKYSAPAPVLSITDNHGTAVAVKRQPSVQVIAPQVAARAADILQGDTRGFGTSASEFSSWYAANSSVIAGKTGTNESTKKGENGAVWFVGVTPKLVGAAGVINFDSTSAPSTGLVGEGKGQAYGDFAAKVWVDALKPSLTNAHWTWPDPDQVGSDDVPNIAGRSLSDAKAQLAAAHFKLQELDATDNVFCPSSLPYNTVAFYGPHRADPGTTITVCLSSGVPQHVAAPPPVRHSSHPGSSSSGSGSNGRRTTIRTITITPTPPRSHGHGHNG
jgi:membrane peptidoglycan carboxypeptidase